MKLFYFADDNDFNEILFKHTVAENNMRKKLRWFFEWI